MARIYDNLENSFQEGLENMITNIGVKRVDFCVGYFNIRGWKLVVNQIDKLPGDTIYENDIPTFRKCRLLIGMYSPPLDIVRELYLSKKPVDREMANEMKMEIARDFRRQLEIGIPSNQDEKTIDNLKRQLKDGTVCVKLSVKKLHAKLYISYRPEDKHSKIYAILGSSNLTYSGLYYQGELNAEFSDTDDAEKLSEWFKDRWEDNYSIDVTEELIKALDESWAGQNNTPPYHIYLKTAYHLSEDARSGILEYTIPQEFENKLFDFQKNAVIIAAKHLNNKKRGGAMIGDVVGLGKTITACTIAKMFEYTWGGNTLIICPAHLMEMWDKYIKDYNLRAEVKSMAEDFDKDTPSRYKLIIIDESHNLRNRNGKRYKAIRAFIQRQESKVLLLTATPYNKEYKDMSSQLGLFLDEEDDLGIRPEEYIREMKGAAKFKEKHKVPIRSIKAFELSNHQEDWQELMKLFLVRRTRSYIKKNGAKFNTETNRFYLEYPDGSEAPFPERIPRAIDFETTDDDQYSRLYSKQMLFLMENLMLPRYGLINYLDKKKSEKANKEEKEILTNLSRAGKQMMGFCKSTFFKRIDSCGYSFLLTVSRHILRNCTFLYAIRNGLKLPVSDENSLPDDFLEDQDMNSIHHHDVTEDATVMCKELFRQNNSDATADCLLKIPTDKETYEKLGEKFYHSLIGKNSVDWIDYSYFNQNLEEDLKKDVDALLKMLSLCGNWNTDADQKLNKLEKLITVDHKDEKILVFTQYSDTADYIYMQLEKRGLTHLGRVTGSTQNVNTLVERFSPVSNRKTISDSRSIRVLIATDVLSEGQNLQDAHIIVNYDLPWAIIRLIQRAGRVDRIGQTATDIYCYSFFPADKVEEIIKLRKRLNERINENAGIVGSDEYFFEGNDQNLLDIYNEKSGCLDDDDSDLDVDVCSQAYQIWKNATENDPALAYKITSMKNVVYSTKKASNNQEDGVITYARNNYDYDVLTWYNSKSEIVSQSPYRILQAMECQPNEPWIEPQENHHELVARAVKSLKNDGNNVAGILGNRFNIKRRLYVLLKDYFEKPLDIFNTKEKKEELKYAIDQIYNHHLRESSKDILNNMLRSNKSQEDIADKVIELYQDNLLCKVENEDNAKKDPTIICSMGLKAI